MIDRTCVICGKGVLTRKIIDETFEYKGQELTISDYVIYECDKCKEAIVDPRTIRSTEKKLIDFRRVAEASVPLLKM